MHPARPAAGCAARWCGRGPGMRPAFRARPPGTTPTGRTARSASFALDGECSNLSRAAISEMRLSARAHHKILRTGRTIGDLDDSAETRPGHLNEAIDYRVLGRSLCT